MASYTSHVSSGIGNLNLYEKLVESFEKMPDETSKIIKNYFKSSDITSKVNTSVKSGIPVSNVINKKYKGTARDHAKYASSIKVVPGNKGFLITNEKYYQYLIFPNLGIGKSKGKPPKNFVQKGIDSNISIIEKELENKLQEGLSKESFFN